MITRTVLLSRVLASSIASPVQQYHAMYKSILLAQLAGLRPVSSSEKGPSEVVSGWCRVAMGGGIVYMLCGAAMSFLSRGLAARLYVQGVFDLTLSSQSSQIFAVCRLARGRLPRTPARNIQSCVT